MSTERCPNCDRVECDVPAAVEATRLLAETMPDDVRADDPRWEPSDRRNAAASADCHRHRVDWRARALSMAPVVAAAERAEARLAKLRMLRPLSTDTDREHKNVETLAAYIALADALDAYRARGK